MGWRDYRPEVEKLEDRTAPALLASDFAPLVPPPVVPAVAPLLTQDNVATLLDRAAAATAQDSAIVAVVDRGGRLLGVRVEGNVSTAITSNPEKLTFAIDGAIAEARTAAFFANNTAPLTSRTVQDLSQSTITQREVNSDPSITDTNSPLYGPGLVAPIEIGGHFPPNVADTPSADLFNIQVTNEDTSVIGGVTLPSRFNVPLADIPAGVQSDPLAAPDSYGFISGLEPNAQPRGIGTLPGGIPIFDNGTLVGGIGVFFPGTTGYASEENSSLSADYNPSKPDLSLEAEYIAFAAVGGSSGAGFSIGTLGGFAPLPGFDLPNGRIDEAGITLDLFGPGGTQGPQNLVTFGNTLGTGDGTSGVNKPVDRSGDLLEMGMPVPDGWLVTPHAGVAISAAQVTQIIEQGINQAYQTRAQIRLPIGNTTRMVFAVADSTGAILGLYRMPDATVFSIGVAVAKARNTAYYDDPAQLQSADQLAGVPAGTAFTNRTFRYLALPQFPEGIDGTPGPFSILNDPGTNPQTGLNTTAPLPASNYTSVLGYVDFHPNANFHAKTIPQNQNGVVFFPGSSGVYINGGQTILGGFGVSGDGVDEDDVVTAGGIAGFEPKSTLRADFYSFHGVRLPYQNFNRNPDEL